jgi:hypothetical protein
MGILNSVAETGLTAVGLGGIFKRNTDPKGFGADFPSGMVIQEIVDGAPVNDTIIQLVGSFLPLIPFEFGGKQQLAKDYYPGNEEPVVQVLGARENDVTINGRLKTKRFKDIKLRAVAEQYQDQIDDMRKRGNLVMVTLGNWKRYCFISDASFKLKRQMDIDYSITFLVMGLKLPKNCKMIDGGDGDITAAHEKISAAAVVALANARNYPASMPRSISDFMDDMTSAVADVVHLVTNFVDGALKDVEGIAKSANRAVGLIKHARTTISQTVRRIGALQLTVSNLGQGITLDSFKTAAQFNNADHIKKTVNNYGNLALLLSQLQARFSVLSKTVPLRRHLVKNGDTLQKLAIKYYNDANLWKNIYDHNKLTSVTLVVSTVLEIPKI